MKFWESEDKLRRIYKRDHHPFCQPDTKLKIGKDYYARKLRN